MAALEDMVRENTEKAPAGNPSTPEAKPKLQDLQEQLKAARAKGDEQAVARLEQQLKTLQRPQADVANGGVANANGAADAGSAVGGGGGARPLVGNGNAGAPDYSDAFAPANTQSVQLEADGRQGLETALRKAGYSPEETRSGRVLNQILKDNQIDSMNSLKAGSRVSIPSRSQSGGGAPAWGGGGGGGSTWGGGGGGAPAWGGGVGSGGGVGAAGGGYQSAFPAPPLDNGNAGWGGEKPKEDTGGAKGGANVKPQVQSNGVSCGQASVAMAVNSLTGKNLTDRDISRKHGFSLLSALNQESRGSGYKWADSGNFDRSKWPLLEKKLNEEKTPVLIGLNGPQFSPSGRGHIVTLMSIDGDKVRYADPADGKIKVTTRQAIESAKSHPDGKFLFTASKGQ
jgi:hypothetical protein